MFTKNGARSNIMEMTKKLMDLKNACISIEELWSTEYFNLDAFNDSLLEDYPFEQSFDEMLPGVCDWVNTSINKLQNLLKEVDTMAEEKSLIDSVLAGKSVRESIAAQKVNESSEQFTRKEMIRKAQEQIDELTAFVNFVSDQDNDLVDISFEIDKLERNEGEIRRLLNDCEDY